MNRLAVLWLLLGVGAAAAPPRTNDPAAVETFRDRGLGLFIHWSVDGSLGGVISHSLVGASPDYVERFYRLLPGYFNPEHFEPEKWASLAKLAGFEYVMFTAKHHNGFAMWDTQTTPFSTTHTPYGKDITRRLVDAFRKQGLAIGLYFSPDDFWWLYKHGIAINRHVAGVYPQEIPEFMDYTRRQLRELLTNYGPIDYFFFDGPAEQLTDFAWSLQPKLVITRGVMETPEQYIPGVALPGAWEGNLTMGTEWPWKATNEQYKSGTELIDILIETRAKGGNLLLNIGPKPDGEIPIEQESRLREIALWNFVNGEALKGVRPWVITNEKDVWFTSRKDSNTVYAFLTHDAALEVGRRENDYAAECASDTADRDQRLGTGRHGGRIPAGCETEDGLEAGRRRSAHHGVSRTTALHGSPLAESSGTQDHERSAGLNAAGCRNSQRGLGRCNAYDDAPGEID